MTLDQRAALLALPKPGPVEFEVVPSRIARITEALDGAEVQRLEGEGR